MEPRIFKSHILKAFDKAANNYDEEAKLQKLAGVKLLQQLNFLIDDNAPHVIADVGAGTGYFSQLMAHTHNQSEIITIDMAYNMLHEAKKNLSAHNSKSLVCADFDYLPLLNNSTDCIFSNFAVQWSYNLNKTFYEFKRILRASGLLLFTTFGPESFFELKSSWKEVDDYRHVNVFPSVSEIHKLLNDLNYTSINIYSEKVDMYFSNVMAILKNFKSIGANFVIDRDNFGLLTRNKLRKLEKAYKPYFHDGQAKVTYEIIYCVARASTVVL